MVSFEVVIHYFRVFPWYRAVQNQLFSGFKYLKITGDFRVSFLDPIMGLTPPGPIIMFHYWYFWKFAPHPHLCKLSRVPTMLVVLSVPFINHSIPFIYPPFLKMCHPHRTIATINQLIKIDSSSINYPEENEIILTY